MEEGNENIVRKYSRSSIASAPVTNPGLARISLILVGISRGGDISWPSHWLVGYEEVKAVSGDYRRLLAIVVCAGPGRLSEASNRWEARWKAASYSQH